MLSQDDAGDLAAELGEHQVGWSRICAVGRCWLQEFFGAEGSVCGSVDVYRLWSAYVFDQSIALDGRQVSSDAFRDHCVIPYLSYPQ